MAAHVGLLSHLLLRVLKVAIMVVLLVIEEQIPTAHHLWSQRMIKGAVVMADLAGSWMIAARHRVGMIVRAGICIWIGVYQIDWIWHHHAVLNIVIHDVLPVDADLIILMVRLVV